MRGATTYCVLPSGRSSYVYSLAIVSAEIHQPANQKHLDNFKTLALEIKGHNERAVKLQGLSSDAHEAGHNKKSKQEQDQKPTVHDEER